MQSAIVGFVLITLPGTIDAYWSLLEKFREVDTPSLNFGVLDWILPSLGFALLTIVLWQVRKGRHISAWLEEALSSDIERIAKAMRGRATRWDFSGIYNREPYFDVYIELTNTTIFTFSLKGASGFVKIAGQSCVNLPHVSVRHNIRRDDPANIRVRQPIAPETSAIIQNAGNSNTEIQFDLAEVVFELENTTRGYEQHKPYLTGGVRDMVPKNGLKLEPQVTTKEKDTLGQRQAQLQYDIRLLTIEGKHIFDRLKAAEAEGSSYSEDLAIAYFEDWYNRVSETLQRAELKQYYPLWYRDAGGLDRSISRIPHYIKACEAGLNTLEGILSD